MQPVVAALEVFLALTATVCVCVCVCMLLAWSEYQVDSRDARYARRAQQILLT